MPKLTKIYTKTGDDGTTALGSRLRVHKNDLRVETYGTIDELNSMIGLALSFGLEEKIATELKIVQNTLLHLGSDLAFPEDDKKAWQVPRIEDKHVTGLESKIDEINSLVGPLENFILPGGTQGAAALQVARAICRRAERMVVSLSQSQAVKWLNLVYLNRLSDLLFVMGRYENQQKGMDEPLWDSHA